jgi:hypothetical protein
MGVLIESESPATWRELEERVARILGECGYEVETQKTIRLARGLVNVDVYAVEQTTPPNVLVVECKNWKQPVTKTVVHSFRTVVVDSGANAGLIVSAAGFQSGAIEAAAYTNIQLVNWEGFQQLFVERWFIDFMSLRIREEADPLVQYVEPFNSRILQKADALSAERRQHFKELRQRLAMEMMGFLPMMWQFPLSTELPDLPLRKALASSEVAAEFPDDVLDANALRPLMEALIRSYREAIAEFDQVFGGRA